VSRDLQHWARTDRIKYSLFLSSVLKKIISKSQEQYFMSAPSRRPEIRRRRTRKVKVLSLRKRLAKATTESDRTQITAKLHRLELVSPRNPLLKKD